MRLTEYQKQGILTAIMDDVPEQDEEVMRQKVQDALIEAMSPEIQKIYVTHPKALCTEYLSPTGWGHSCYLVGDADVREVMKPFHDEADKRREAKNRLKTVIDGCSTLKQLQAALPECAKYMPTEEAPSKNLPAIANAVSGLVALGWPKNKAAT